MIYPVYWWDTTDYTKDGLAPERMNKDDLYVRKVDGSESLGQMKFTHTSPFARVYEWIHKAENDVDRIVKKTVSCSSQSNPDV
jgi:hypothetical protein